MIRSMTGAPGVVFPRVSDPGLAFLINPYRGSVGTGASGAVNGACQGQRHDFVRASVARPQKHHALGDTDLSGDGLPLEAAEKRGGGLGGRPLGAAVRPGHESYMDMFHEGGTCSACFGFRSSGHLEDRG